MLKTFCMKGKQFCLKKRLDIRGLTLGPPGPGDPGVPTVP